MNYNREIRMNDYLRGYNAGFVQAQKLFSSLEDEELQKEIESINRFGNDHAFPEIDQNHERRDGCPPHIGEEP